MAQSKQNIAIIGTGISGLAAAALLHPHHTVTVYEKNDYIGGHARTRRIHYGHKAIDVDTGFIVFNHRTYPLLTALLKYLDVPTQKSVMSFGVTSEVDDLEWSAESPKALFGQHRNLWRPAFYRFLFDIIRFNYSAVKAAHANPDMTLGDLITHMGLSDWFRRYYILPMGGAIWSCSLTAILSFPATFFVDFFEAHGLLTVTNQPQWYTVTGGSQVYIDKLTASFKDRIHLSCAATAVTRSDDLVRVTDINGRTLTYDDVIFAGHADETLAILKDATVEERSVLGAFRYQQNTAILHNHTALMPKRQSCWASWVYHAEPTPTQDPISVTYWMNHLQQIDPTCPLFVTLNPRTPIPQSATFESHVFDHPIYNPAAVAAQAILPRLQGVKHSWFCGAYHRNGFHEDGLASAVDIATRMGVTPPWK